jgi:ABC-2 type transport system ATP-binding protein
VRVGGVDPARSATTRRRIGALGEDPWLPSARTVGAAVALALAARGADLGSARAEIERLGLAPLLARRPDALGYPEARAVELALALATPEPLLVAVHEPLCDVATAAPAAVRARLAELADAGACVLVTTSSAADARALGARAVGLSRGVLRPVFAPGPGPVAGELVAVVACEPASALRALAARLAERPEIRGVSWLDAPTTDAERPAIPARLAVAGDDVAACAVALAEDAVALGVQVRSITSTSPGRSAP